MIERFHALPLKRRRAALILMALIICTIAFIWSNSLQNPDESMRRSDVAEKVIRPIVLALPVKQWHSEDMVTFITRKLGHFTEYFLLGAELMLLALLLRPAFCLRFIWLLLFAGAIAAMDESLQLTSGRGAAVSDVLLDIFGALAGLMMMALAAGLYAKGRQKRA
ncbi:MAG: hypothetical protein EOM58_01280 [Clostridia bacterium]|nr:hypothetical protein [Clostridia bacterium]